MKKILQKIQIFISKAMGEEVCNRMRSLEYTGERMGEIQYFNGL